ncbi:MAG TPA: hypothetical protein VGP05_18360 [Pseudonocardia sp.]|jgi:hypothetical protein|nr:hypothetical protein [Pseudonocardia sp.]
MQWMPRSPSAAPELDVPAIGLALAELALDGTTTLAIDHLDPARPLGAGTVRRTVASALASLAPLH